MRRFLISLAIVLGMSSMSVKAQSVSYAKSLIQQGRYLEAAKQLRPLADGGNAEAQYLAAWLFFEGYGVSKSEEQGIKYATMAANQGNIGGIEHYQTKLLSYEEQSKKKPADHRRPIRNSYFTHRMWKEKQNAI